MRHLYEIAVITAYTAAPTPRSTASVKEPDSITSQQQGAPHQVVHQLQPSHCWTPASWNFPTGQGDNVWSAPASVSSMYPATGQNWSVENASSVSRFTSEESTCSWETDCWSRESLVSQESIFDPTNRQNGIPFDSNVLDAVYEFERFNLCAPINPDSLCKDVTFMSGAPNPGMWENIGDTTDANYEDMSEDQFDQELLRVAQGSSVQSVNQVKVEPLLAPTVPQVKGNTGVTNQTCHRFTNLQVDEENCLYLLQQNLVSGSEYSVCDTLNAVQFQMSRGDSIADSGLVSRSSSLASLLAESSDTSEGNLADMESCESLVQQSTKSLNGKKLSRGSTYDKTSNSANTSMATPQAISQPQAAAFTNTSIQNVGQPPGHYTTNECSESVTSCSLSSDSERSDVPSLMKNLDAIQWTRMKQKMFQGLQSTAFACHSREDCNSSTQWKPEGSIHQTSHIRTDSSFACRPPADQHSQKGLSLWDSGVGNTRDLTQLWDTSSATNTFACVNVNESSHLMETAQYYFYPDCVRDTTSYANEVVNRPVRLETPPYNCCLDHDSEFIPIQALDVHKLPRGYQGWEHLQKILEISYRVVKLRVHKPFKMTQQEDNGCECKPADTGDDASEEPVLQHYGTGFACHIDKETVVIRTHSELIGSALEASRTDVLFVMTFPDGSPSQEITCRGLPDNFSSNDHTKTSKLTCRTPPDLIYYWHLFKDVPIVRHNSLFNDSCYFTDSSPDISGSGPDDLESERDSALQKDKGNIHTVHPDAAVAKSNVSGGSVTSQGNMVCLYSHVLANRKQESVKLATEKSSYNEGCPLTNTPAERFQYLPTINLPSVDSCVNMTDDREHKTCDSFICTGSNTFFSPANEVVLPDDTTIITSRINMSSGHECGSRSPRYVDSLHSTVPHVPWPDVGHTRFDFPSGSRLQCLQQTAQESSPLAIMERRYDELNAASGTQFCPYVGQDVFGRSGTYTSFTSFAGDVFSSLAPDTFASSTPKTDERADTIKWEYEKLLFLQNHYRDSYNKLNRPATISHPGPGGDFRNTTSEIANKESTNDKFVSITAHDIDNQRLTTGEMPKANPSFGQSSVGVVKKHAVERDSPMGKRLTAGDCQSAQSGGQTSSLLTDSGDDDSTAGGSRVNVFAEFASVESYLDTWDRDLINLDTDLSPVPDMDFIETMVNNLLESSDEEAPRRDTNLSAVCCPQNLSKRSSGSGSGLPDGHDSVCLIISYPHGGPKMLSFGLFSRHGHLGGVLYDTPTCMGSCGAPVVALAENMESPYLTHFLHSGTVKVNGVSVGAAVSYFDKLPSLH